MVTISKPKLLALVIILLAATVGWESYVLVVALPALGRNSVVTPGGQTTPCTYDNYQDSGKFIGRNCKTGENDFIETTAGQLAVDENQSSIVRFWEAGTWDFCPVSGFCAPGGGLSDNNVANVADWGIYGATIFRTSNTGGAAYIIGNQNANDAVYHAFNITLHDVTLDGNSVGNSVCLSITTALNVQVYHVALQNCNNLDSGGLRLTNWNAQQIQSKNIFMRDLAAVKVKVGLTGATNGYLRDSTFTGMTPGNTVNYLVDFSKGDFPPSAANNLGNFCFCGNMISGWTLNGIFAGFQAVSNDTIAGNTIVGAAGFIVTTDFAGTNYFNGLDVTDNWYSQSTGAMNFQYGNFITILNNHWTLDSTPASGATALAVGPDASALINQPGQPNHVNIQGNTIRKWGGVGMVLNFTNGLVEGNQIYNVNQANGNANSNAGMLIEKGLRNVLVIGNEIVSDVNSGAGQSRPVNYLGAAKNITLISNDLFYQAFGGAQASGIFFNVAADKTLRAFDNFGYNPVGKLTNFIVAGAGIGICGTGSTPVSTTAYVVCGTPIFWTCTGGTVTAIAVTDFSGNQLFSVANCAALPATTVYSPIGYKITFTFSVVPTVTVFAT